MALSSRLANMSFMKQAAVKQAAVKQEGGMYEAGQTEALQKRQHHRARQAGAAGVQQEQSAAVAKAERDRPAQPSPSAAAPGQSSDRQGQQQPHAQQQQQQQHAAGKYQLSETITNMKFMQRAQLKRSREEAFDKEQAAKDAAEWVAPTAVQDKGCLILHERDPLPAGVSGRMSFGFGHFHELQQAEEAERQAAAEVTAAAAAAGAQIKDEDMAGSSFGGKQKQSWAANIMRPKDMAKRAARETKRQRR